MGNPGSTRHRRAVHQRGQERDPLDPAVMPEVPQQRGAAPASRAGLQPRQLHAEPGAARCRETVVTDQPARQAHQDRREDRPPRALRHVPDGRSRHPARPVRRHPAPYRPAQTATNSIMIGKKPFLHAVNRTGAPGLRARRSHRNIHLPFTDQNHLRTVE